MCALSMAWKYSNHHQIQTECSDVVGPSAKSDEDETPQSVIYAPPGFEPFVSLSAVVCFLLLSHLS